MPYKGAQKNEDLPAKKSTSFESSNENHEENKNEGETSGFYFAADNSRKIIQVDKRHHARLARIFADSDNEEESKGDKPMNKTEGFLKKLDNFEPNNKN